jgi:hypothetical protein
LIQTPASSLINAALFVKVMHFSNAAVRMLLTTAYPVFGKMLAQEKYLLGRSKSGLH